LRRGYYEKNNPFWFPLLAGVVRFRAGNMGSGDRAPLPRPAPPTVLFIHGNTAGRAPAWKSLVPHLAGQPHKPHDFAVAVQYEAARAEFGAPQIPVSRDYDRNTRAYRAFARNQASAAGPDGCLVYFDAFNIGYGVIFAWKKAACLYPQVLCARGCFKFFPRKNILAFCRYSEISQVLPGTGPGAAENLPCAMNCRIIV